MPPARGPDTIRSPAPTGDAVQTPYPSNTRRFRPSIKRIWRDHKQPALRNSAKIDVDPMTRPRQRRLGPGEDIFESAFNGNPMKLPHSMLSGVRLTKIWPTSGVIASFAAKGWHDTYHPFF